MSGARNPSAILGHLPAAATTDGPDDGVVLDGNERCRRQYRRASLTTDPGGRNGSSGATEKERSK